MKRYSIALFSILTTACGGGGVDVGGIDFGPIDIPDQAVGGAWVGTDSDGNEVLALVTESGRLNWISTDTGEQGFGTVSVGAITTTIDYTLVPLRGSTLSDESTSAICEGGGSIGQRDFWFATVNCTTSLGSSIGGTTELTYDALYDRDSSLALIAGDYDDSGLVVSVNSNGEIFEQDPVSGCVVNGSVGIIESRFNLYDISISYSNCLGSGIVLNGSTFTGLAILDDSVVPETAVIGLTGTVGEETYSLVLQLPRL